MVRLNGAFFLRCRIRNAKWLLEQEDKVKIREIMTSKPACCSPEDSIEAAARMMEQKDCGCLPVVEGKSGGRLVGVVTDRDIAVRAVGHGRGSDTRVRDVMTSSPHCCRAENEVGDLERLMSDRQVRRVPIIDDSGSCVGIVAQADLARASERTGAVSAEQVGRVVERISEPNTRR
jgi:CBS domain-containing protein